MSSSSFSVFLFFSLAFALLLFLSFFLLRNYNKSSSITSSAHVRPISPLTHTSVIVGVFCSVLSEGGAWSNACLLRSFIVRTCVIFAWYHEWSRVDCMLTLEFLPSYCCIFAQFRHTLRLVRTPKYIYILCIEASFMIQLTPTTSSLSFKTSRQTNELVALTEMTSIRQPQDNQMDVDESIERVSVLR